MKYLDELIKHNISFSEKGLVLADSCKSIIRQYLNEIEDLLIEYKNISVKRKQKEIKEKIKELCKEAECNLYDEIIDFTAETITAENKWFSKVGKQYFKKPFDIPDKLENLIKDYPFVTVGTIYTFASEISKRMYNKSIGLVDSSYILGVDFEDLLKDADFDSIERITYNDAESIGESLGNVYDRLVYTRNEKIIDKYQWISILDTNTCPACGELNGKVFDDISKIPLYPVHRCCRCTLLSLPAETEPIDIPKYSDWIESQDEETKRNILGKTRYSLYREGMKISQFYANGKKINLKDLKK